MSWGRGKTIYNIEHAMVLLEAHQRLWRLEAQRVLAMSNTLRCGLVHLLGLQHTAIHHDIGQVGEE